MGPRKQSPLEPHTEVSGTLTHTRFRFGSKSSQVAAVHVLLKAVCIASGYTASPVYFPHTSAVIKQDLYLRTTTKTSNEASSDHYCSQGRPVKIAYFNRRYWRLELSQRRSLQQVGLNPLSGPIGDKRHTLGGTNLQIETATSCVGEKALSPAAAVSTVAHPKSERAGRH